MIIDGGIILILVGAVTLLLGPAQDAIAYRRWLRTAIVGETLRAAVPIAAPSPSLDRLVAEADAALARDQLLGGIAGINAIYSDIIPRG